ncbi:hypothetical protein DL96DRAFT_1751428 [Flagelloscypha sp. PMI_526]|nr:hypothetical protein DL96DRAFT_1751428 [Flagelloscypha sp. PMI_526]
MSNANCHCEEDEVSFVLQSATKPQHSSENVLLTFPSTSSCHSKQDWIEQLSPNMYKTDQKTGLVSLHYNPFPLEDDTPAAYTPIHCDNSDVSCSLPQCSSSQADDVDCVGGVIRLRGPIGRGSTGSVWRGTFEDALSLDQPVIDVIAKFAVHPADRHVLAHEADIYATRLPRLQEAGIVPRTFGYFTSDIDEISVLLLEDCSGVSLGSWTDGQRQMVYDALIQIHVDAGILHNDVRLDNVLFPSSHTTSSRPRPSIQIIDFSHATMGHECPGPNLCLELRGVLERCPL